ncbi:hypothetical protein [Dyadobacter pollutisoli]|jgi:hypothetical protein|uniref:Uncharacterized protein n=1 Tax=Dyadobacter pollutisoli TaxID=2910158 RepID=A0A9E8N9S1_9BACT|nr:hypothetical protein [Dyadobacter pollutisoli]WAC12595.1 hypothetical protein ON006_01250 [Dyadobacter pollutisoli]
MKIYQILTSPILLAMTFFAYRVNAQVATNTELEEAKEAITASNEMVLCSTTENFWYSGKRPPKAGKCTGIRLVVIISDRLIRVFRHLSFFNNGKVLVGVITEKSLLDKGLFVFIVYIISEFFFKI